MAVCNLFKKLTKETGNFLMFSQYADDLTKFLVRHNDAKVIPSRYLLLNVDYTKLNNIQEITVGDLNEKLPTYLQNYYENACAFFKGYETQENNVSNFVYTPVISRNVFWNAFSKLLTFEPWNSAATEVIGSMSRINTSTNLKYIPEFVYRGDINLQSYTEEDNIGYNEIYCYVPNDAQRHEYCVKQQDPTSYVTYDREYVEGYSSDDEGFTGLLDIKIPYNTQYTYDESVSFLGEYNEYLEDIALEDKNFKFNTILVLYDIYYKVNNDDEVRYKDIPLGLYLTGTINDDGTVTNDVTKYVSNSDIYGAGTSYGLRIATRFSVTPNATYIKEIEVDGGSDYTEFAKVMSSFSKSQMKMNEVLSTVNQNENNIKDQLSSFKNYRTNIPYIVDVNGTKYWFVNGKNTNATVMGSVGPTGPTGPMGPQGRSIPGERGAQGVTGLQGLQGVTGEVGPTGIQGETGIQGVTGLRGIRGVTGLQGVTGSQGVTGPRGFGDQVGITGTLENGEVIATVIVNRNDEIQDYPIKVEYPVTDILVDNVSVVQNGVAYINSLTGATGVQGETGIQGVTGLQGETGIQGVTGLQGETGIQGVTGLQGETGVQGVTGLQGETGIQGVTGLQGETGIQGVTGLQGETGIQGVTGLQGETGPTGKGFHIDRTYPTIAAMEAATGVGVGEFAMIVTSSITDPDYGLVYMKTETGWAFQVDMSVVGATGLIGPTGETGPQGVTGLQGETGVQGVTGLQGETGPQGNVGHIYSITKDSLAEGVLTVIPGPTSIHVSLNTASGIRSHAEGISTTASGQASHTEGNVTGATGDYSHAEGNGSVAGGNQSHAEGKGTIASTSAHAEGEFTTASGQASHAEGDSTIASGYASHTQGVTGEASGYASSVEGIACIAGGTASHAEGEFTTASNNQAHAEGRDTVASGIRSHAEGESTTASGTASHAEGSGTVGLGLCSHAECGSAIASGDYSHAEGLSTTASGTASHTQGVTGEASGYASSVEGIACIAGGTASHAEGEFTTASNNQAHAEGSGTNAYGEASHAEGCSTGATGAYSHAEGYYTIASGIASHAEGYMTEARGNCSHAEGGSDSYDSPIAYGDYSHVEGRDTSTYGTASHAEGYSTGATGAYSHAEGANTKASGIASHAGGFYTIADCHHMTAIGQYNETGVTGAIFVIGNGDGDDARRNVFTVVDDQGTSGNSVVVTVDGTIHATSITQTSDIRKKNIISEIDLDKAYKMIDKCQTILYSLKSDPQAKQQIGVIAQEVREYFPEIVEEDTWGNLSLDYTKLTVIIMRVMKDIIDRVKRLESIK